MQGHRLGVRREQTARPRGRARRAPGRELLGPAGRPHPADEPVTGELAHPVLAPLLAEHRVAGVLTGAQEPVVLLPPVELAERPCWCQAKSVIATSRRSRRGPRAARRDAARPGARGGSSTGVSPGSRAGRRVVQDEWIFCEPGGGACGRRPDAARPARSHRRAGRRRSRRGPTRGRARSRPRPTSVRRRRPAARRPRWTFLLGRGATWWTTSAWRRAAPLSRRGH